VNIGAKIKYTSRPKVSASKSNNSAERVEVKL
ncbi:uncharacterized protein METZ01_LOCUS314030, partial [marine metagenome]